MLKPYVTKRTTNMYQYFSSCTETRNTIACIAFSSHSIAPNIVVKILLKGACVYGQITFVVCFPFQMQREKLTLMKLLSQSENTKTPNSYIFTLFPCRFL